MAISSRTRSKVGLPPKHTEADEEAALQASLGVQSSSMIVEDRHQISKAEQELLASKALTVEDDPWNQLPNERRTNLIRHTYSPVLLANLCLQNNTLGQCLDAYEVNIDGTGFDVERKDNFTPDEDEDDDNIQPLKDMFNSIYINESFLSIRRKVRRDRHATGNGYMEVLRNEAGEITLINHLDAKLVYMVKLDDPVEVERTIKRGGKDQQVKMLVRERRFAMMIGNKVRYFREFGSSREVNAETGEWMGPSRQATSPMFVAPTSSTPEFKATNDQDKLPKEPGMPGAQPVSDAGVITESDTSDELGLARKKKAPFGKADSAEFPPKPTPTFVHPPRREDDPTKAKPDTSLDAVSRGTEVLHFKDHADVSTPYGIPLWIPQIPSVLGSRKAEELNLEYFNHGGMPPVMIFLQGGQLSQKSKDTLNRYLSGEAKTKMRAVVADVYATGGDLNSNSQVKVLVERFGGEQQSDSMFENYDERCSMRVRCAFRLPPLFTGDTQDYTFATAYASYVVAEAQVFKPEREMFDEVINNTIMKEIAPEYVFRSLPLSVHDVAVQIQALTLAKDVTDTKTFVDELNEISGLNLTFKEPVMPMPGALPGQGDPFAEASFGKPKTVTAMPPAVGVPKPRQAPAAFLKRERLVKAGDESFLRLAEDWASHLCGDRIFAPDEVGVMQECIAQFNPHVRKLFNGYVGMKMAPGAHHDPDGVADLLACAGDHLHG